jgi:hypothetical protein
LEACEQKHGNSFATSVPIAVQGLSARLLKLADADVGRTSREWKKWVQRRCRK